jgi:hypothetical protein
LGLAAIAALVVEFAKAPRFKLIDGSMNWFSFQGGTLCRLLSSLSCLYPDPQTFDNRKESSSRGMPSMMQYPDLHESRAASSWPASSNPTWSFDLTTRFQRSDR